MSESIYSNLPQTAFWRTGVAQASPLNPQGIYSKKFTIERSHNIVTAGSCFAQHISRHLKANGYLVVDAEPAPKTLPAELHANFGYGLYSGRYGNIYTMRQLLQLAKESFGQHVPGEIIWEKNGRYYDALRPNIEPEGFDSPAEVILQRSHHIERMRKLFTEADVIVFTLGLTEAWTHKLSGTVFPTAPGSIAGEFDAEKYEFVNFSFSEIIGDFNEFKRLVQSNQNPDRKARFLLTVSPVPLTATYSGQHVLTATTYSKSVLRAVAGQLFSRQKDVDYYPSFEIINNCWTRGIFYENNLRSVTQEGVNIAMRVFLAEHVISGIAAEPQPIETDKEGAFEDVVCEEALLEAFAK